MVEGEPVLVSQEIDTVGLERPTRSSTPHLQVYYRQDYGGR